jgi:hypothetical protein
MHLQAACCNALPEYDWMGNISAEYKCVPAVNLYKRNPTKENVTFWAVAMEGSAGGCYKWSAGAGIDIIDWPRDFTGTLGTAGNQIAGSGQDDKASDIKNGL